MMFELLVRPLIARILEETEAAAEAIAEDMTPEARSAITDFHEAASATAGDLAGKTRDAFESAASFTGDQMLPQVEAVMATLFGEGLELLGGAHEATAGILDACSAAVEGATVLAAPVNWARGTVDTVNSLLDAMNLGL
jgi:hypothetical protein